MQKIDGIFSSPMTAAKTALPVGGTVSLPSQAFQLRNNLSVSDASLSLHNPRKRTESPSMSNSSSPAHKLLKSDHSGGLTISKGVDPATAQIVAR